MRVGGIAIASANRLRTLKSPMLSLRLLAVVRTFLLATIALTAAACAAQGGLDPPKLILSWGESGQEPGKLFQPTGIAVARGGTVFVADTGNDRVQAFDAAGGFLFAFGSSGEEPSQFRRPMDLDIDAEGLLYVAELRGDRVQVFTPDGKLVRTIRGEDTAAGHFDGAAGIMVAEHCRCCCNRCRGSTEHGGYRTI